jgi:hypothetical protein
MPLKGKQSERKDKTYEEIYGKRRAKEIKNKLSIRFSGDNNPSKKNNIKIKLGWGRFKQTKKYQEWLNKQKTHPNHLGIKFSKKRKENISLSKIGKPNKKVSITRKRMFKEGKLKANFPEIPTKLEKFFIFFFKKYKIPVKYVGNNKLWIGGKCPDFVNKNLKFIIEVCNKNQKNQFYGSWKKYARDRIEHFKKYGYFCFVLFEEDLKKPIVLYNFLIKNIEGVVKSNVDRIKSIEFIGEKEVGDLSMTKNHNFFLKNGILAHNTETHAGAGSYTDE